MRFTISPLDGRKKRKSHGLLKPDESPIIFLNNPFKCEEKKTDACKEHYYTIVLDTMKDDFAVENVKAVKGRCW